MRPRLLLALMLPLAACEGPAGPAGAPGQPGVLPDGAVISGDAGDDAGTSDLDGSLPHGLMGTVRDPSGSPLVRGRVVLLAAERVATLGRTDLNLALPGALAAFAPNDEPLEDAIAQATDLPTAPLDENGRYRFETLPDGTYFVVFVPALEDEVHLPGGNLVDAPIAAEALRGAVIDLRVSGVPTAKARYVGSSSCVACHARHASFASGHALTLRVPGISAPLQDVSGSPRIDEALAAFAQGTVLSFYDCDATRAPAPICAVTTGSSESAVLRVSLREDRTLAADAPGRYYVELTRTGATSLRLPVVLTLGGSHSVQQYVARVALAGGGTTHFVLPFSYQLAGDDARPAYRDRRWVAYRVEDWLELTQPTLHAPAHARAFERECAGCHVTGFSLRGTGTSGFRASAVPDADGIYDLDGDGRKELLLVGCEACHGPGSEHLEVTPRGQRIVSPRLATPERQTMICGACHARHFGLDGELAPLDQARTMPRPGISRSNFLARHVSRIDLSNEVLYPSADPRVAFSQYGDFIRSAKYRNGKLLATCTGCHDPHRSAGYANDLRSEGGNATCGDCHLESKNVTQHAQEKVGYAHDRGLEPGSLTCLRCHMVKTGLIGASVPALVDVGIPGRPIAYWRGDRTSHRFAFTDSSHAAEQPVAATDGCAFCHGEFLPKP